MAAYLIHLINLVGVVEHVSQTHQSKCPAFNPNTERQLRLHPQPENWCDAKLIVSTLAKEEGVCAVGINIVLFK